MNMDLNNFQFSRLKNQCDIHRSEIIINTFIVLILNLTMKIFVGLLLFTVIFSTIQLMPVDPITPIHSLPPVKGNPGQGSGRT